MNPRIKKIDKQATEYAGDVIQATRAEVNKWHSIRMQKFTELFVADCNGIMEKYARANTESDSWAHMISMMQKEMKEHFGVGHAVLER
jgi:hypothetical protein